MLIVIQNKYPLNYLLFNHISLKPADLNTKIYQQKLKTYKIIVVNV